METLAATLARSLPPPFSVVELFKIMDPPHSCAAPVLCSLDLGRQIKAPGESEGTRKGRQQFFRRANSGGNAWNAAEKKKSPSTNEFAQ